MDDLPQPTSQNGAPRHASLQVLAGDLAFHDLPSRCDLRVSLRERGVRPAPPGPFAEVLRRLGRRHEDAHLASLEPVVNLSDGTIAQRAQWTRDEVEKGTPVVYRGVLSCLTELAGLRCAVIAEPGFLVRGSLDYVVRETTVATLRERPAYDQACLRLQLEGWLFKQVFGHAPESLELLAGDGQTVRIDGDRITEIAHSGDGCSISQASASMMSGVVVGHTTGEALEMIEHFRKVMHRELPADEDVLGDAVALEGVNKYPVRIKCALLSWMALKDGLVTRIVDQKEVR